MNTLHQLFVNKIYYILALYHVCQKDLYLHRVGLTICILSEYAFINTIFNIFHNQNDLEKERTSFNLVCARAAERLCGKSRREQLYCFSDVLGE